MRRRSHWALVMLTVQAATLGAQGVATRAVLDPSEDIAFRAMAVPDTVWVGQQATYQVGVFLSDEIRGRLRRNPVFVPPELRSMLAFDLASTNSPPRIVGSRRYEVHVFQRALFPLTAGVHQIPPARLEYALPLSNSFFAREESRSARTDGLVVVAMDPPEAGRPADFRGAVGRLAVQTRYEPRSYRTGHPFTITAVVQGVGNVSLLPRPDLALAWADVVPGAVRVQLDSSTSLVRGRKEFDWIVTPLRPGRHQVPETRYPYFNPYTEQYEVALSHTDPVTVTGPPVAVDRSPIAMTPALSLRRTWQGEVPRPLSDSRAFWLLLALSPLPLAGAWLAGRSPSRSAGPDAEDELLRAARAGGADAALVRRVFAAALSRRVLLMPVEMADRTRLLRALGRAGVTTETAREAAQLMSTLDDAVYGRGEAPGAAVAQQAALVLRAVDDEARSRAALASRRAARSTGAVASLLLLVVSTAAAPWPRVVATLQAGDPVAQRVFTDGLQSYDAREFGVARQAFHELTQARPRSADAWFNFGTASWQLQDTAAAVIGWQRALRLQPAADDVRERLRLAPGTPQTWHGVVPVSLTVVAIGGAVAWLSAIAVLVVAVRTRRRPWVRAGLGLMTTSLLILLGGIAHHEVLGGRNAAVVLLPARLRELPVLSGEAGVEALPGEMVAVLGEQGAWTRIRLTDGRRGWVESQRIETLAVETSRARTTP